MKQRGPKARFWAILTTIDMIAMIYPVKLYFRADSADTQFFAAIVLVGVAFLLAITDTVIAIVAYLQ